MISFHRKITIIAPFPFSEILIILRTNKNENFVELQQQNKKESIVSIGKQTQTKQWSPKKFWLG